MTIIFSFPSYENLARKIAEKKSYELGSLSFKRFPEGESYIKINSDVKNKKVILVCGLENADEKMMALMFFAQTAKEFKAKEVILVAPYLGYMRMDKRFNEGEAVSSNIFAKFLSQHFDELVTIDPHLHRHKKLEEIYTLKCKTLHATKQIVDWAYINIKKPVLIGPDEESNQWVSEVAKNLSCPFIILQKTRYSANEVKISLPKIEEYRNYNPIILDDMISTANTMIETAKHLQIMGISRPACVAVHAIFTENAYENLQKYAAIIATCNTIKHHSNKIDIVDLICEAV